MIYFEMFPGDYLKDTTRLSLTDHGVYFKLMLAYYSEEQALPESLAELYIIAGAITAADKAAVKKVAERYFPWQKTDCGTASAAMSKSQRRKAVLPRAKAAAMPERAMKPSARHAPEHAEPCCSKTCALSASCRTAWSRWHS